MFNAGLSQSTGYETIDKNFNIAGFAPSIKDITAKTKDNKWSGKGTHEYRAKLYIHWNCVNRNSFHNEGHLRQEKAAHRRFCLC